MKTPDIKNSFYSRTAKIRLTMIVLAILPICGCNIIGFLTSPGPFEKKIPPEYDLVAQQDRKILLLIECPRSSGADYDVQKKLISTFKTYLGSQMKIDSDNLIVPPSGSTGIVVQDPVKQAQSLGAGYVLLVQLDEYRLGPLNTRNYFTGEMVSRAMLMDAELGMPVWPKDPGGKIVHIGVDLEIKGRDMALTRLVSATTHCVLRYLYPCEKIGFKNSDEVMTLQDAFEMETF